MFTVIFITLAGIIAGYLLRSVKQLRHVDRSITLTIWVMLFILGITVGENPYIVENIGRFGGQALLISLAAIFGSVVMAWTIHRLFFRRPKKGGKPA